MLWKGTQVNTPTASDAATRDTDPMRYFVEITADEANALEDLGTAKVAQGASGGNGFGSIVAVHEPWLLMRSVELDKTEKNE